MPRSPSPAARSGLPAGIEGPITATTTATINSTTTTTKRPRISATSYPGRDYPEGGFTLWRVARVHLLGILLVGLLAACSAPGSDQPTTTERPQAIITTLAPSTTTSSAGVATSTSRPPATTTTTLDPETLEIEAFPVPSGSRPHDVAPAADGGVWYTAQNLGDLGWLDPVTGETRHIQLGSGSRPHGVIVDDQGTPWVTDGGLNAIVSVDPGTDEVTVYPLPDDAPDANLNTAVFDDQGVLWFTGQAGIYGWLDPATEELEVDPAPDGAGPYGITHTPVGTVFYASLAGSYVGEISGGTVIVHQPPTPNQGARRVWSDSMSRVWVSEWNSGQVSRYDPATDEWAMWALPGSEPATYAVYVDDQDIVWLSDFGGNAIVRFDPSTETFTQYPLPHQPGNVRQILGRPGEIWGAESAADQLVSIRTR